MIFILRSLHLRRLVNEHRPLAWLLYGFALALVASIAFVVAFKYLEEVSWEEAIWQAWQANTTVGYGSRPAESSAGRAATIVLGTIGIALVGATISAVFDYRTDQRERRRMGLMNNPYQDGYVVFNFPGRARFMALARELRDAEEDVGICVVDGRLEELPDSIAALPSIHFVRGSILDKATYERAGLRNSRVVIVFPIDLSVPDSDATTKTVVDLVEQFVETDARVIHVLVDPENEWMFRDSRSTSVLEQLEVLAVVQECQDPYSAPAIQRLLRNTEGANPGTYRPQRIVGWTWRDLQVQSALAAERLQVQVNPLAIIKNGAPDNCPAAPTVIEEGDLLSMVTYRGLDWDQFEQELVRGRADVSS
ncbi:MAG: hypothetical protein CL878_05080 [Dehalococcoidia bacterium]|nr:hypothetical protein [Dehalococcoidia bacterium]